jgi:hypothetical protein
MRHGPVPVVLVLAALALWPAAASANRAATAAERAQLVADVAGQQGAPDYGAPECFSMRISTVNRNWATTRANGDCDDTYMRYLYHREATGTPGALRWTALDSLDDGDDVYCSEQRTVSTAVGRDLDWCQRDPTPVLRWTKNGGDAVRPSAITLIIDFRLVKLRWSRWTTSGARARGFMVETIRTGRPGGGTVISRSPASPVTVRLSRTVECEDGMWIYTRMTVRVKKKMYRDHTGGTDRIDCEG